MSRRPSKRRANQPLSCQSTPPPSEEPGFVEALLEIRAGSGDANDLASELALTEMHAASHERSPARVRVAEGIAQTELIGLGVGRLRVVEGEARFRRPVRGEAPAEARAHAQTGVEIESIVLGVGAPGFDEDRGFEALFLSDGGKRGGESQGEGEHRQAMAHEDLSFRLSCDSA